MVAFLKNALPRLGRGGGGPALLTITPLIEKLKRDLAALEHGAAKADMSQKAAGTRIRKVMQIVKTEAQDIRLALVAK